MDALSVLSGAHVPLLGATHLARCLAAQLRAYDSRSLISSARSARAIGRMPAATLAAEADLVGRITHRPSVTRQEVLEVFERSHVLLHTAVFESAGSVFTEAMAAGMAIVAPYDGTEHLADWCAAGGATLIDRTGLTRDEVIEAFSSALIDLAADRARLEAMGQANYETASRMWSHPASRNALLARLYGDASGSRHAPLRLQDLVGAGERVFEFKAGEFEQCVAEYAAASGLAGRNLYPVLEL